MRIVIGEDQALFRDGLRRLLTDAGFDVVGEAADSQDLLRKVTAFRPDVVVTDVRMPPGNRDDGLQAAIAIRDRFPGTAVLVLSQYVYERTALDLLGESPGGVGYLLKDRVADIEEFLDAVARVSSGGSALDSQVVARLLGRHRASPLDDLTTRERDVLALMAEGHSNSGIAARLVVSKHAVEKHVSSIFRKLALPSASTEHPRVLAVLAYLRSDSADA